MASALTHTKLSSLVIKFLKSIDQWNSSDTTLSDTDTDEDTAGERARICLNQALHQIYSLIKDSKYLESYPSTNLSSTANQDYIDLDPEAYLDDIQGVTETTNQKIKLRQRSWNWYRRHYPDPSQVTGDPIFYIRRGNRMYLAPRPTSSVVYTIDFVKLTKDLELAVDLPLIPTQYDFWVIAEATVIWYTMEDPTSVPALVIAERDSKRQAGMQGINTSFDRILQSGSNTETDPAYSYAFKRPVG